MKIFTPAKQLVSPHEQSADFVELFFDLVFVYAITRITSITAHQIDVEHILQSVLIFWLVWWAWTTFTSVLNNANTRLAEVRMIVLIATAVAFVMASFTSEAFGTGVIWFAVPYVIIRGIGIGLYIRVTASLHQNRPLTNAATISIIIATNHHQMRWEGSTKHPPITAANPIIEISVNSISANRF